MVEEREEAYFIEIEAFVICEEDNDDGLTWKEVSNCIVSHFIYLGAAIYLKNKHTPQFQEFFA